MSECIFCHTALPNDAGFCASCGQPQRGDAAGARPLINPEAQRAYVATAQAAQGLVSALGIEKTLCLVGGALPPFSAASCPRSTLTACRRRRRSSICR